MLKTFILYLLLKTINKRFQQKNHLSYLIRISSIVKLTKLSKFEFEVRFLKNQKNYKNSSPSKFDIRFDRTES
jgi:hypothetical protein